MVVENEWGSAISIESFLVFLDDVIWSKGKNPNVKYLVEESTQKFGLRTYNLINLTGDIDGEGEMRIVEFSDKRKVLKKDETALMNLLLVKNIKMRYAINDPNYKYVAKMFLKNGSMIKISVNY
jgi:hypothetical protein